MKRCFVIMPLSPTSDKHTELYWDNFFSKFIRPSIEELGYSCSRSKAQPSNIIKDVIQELIEFDLILAVLTDYNANVWYELGIRHALRKGTIMIIEEGQKLPFDISQYGVIRYDDTISGAADFDEKLRTFVVKIETDKPADSPVIDFWGNRTQGDYEQRLIDMEASYQSKLDKIVKLLQDFQKDRTEPEAIKETEPWRGKRKVLWVDDYPGNNEAIIDLYRRQGVEFDLALNTTQALDFLAKEEYDLIISDMGRGSEADAGLRMIREIKRHFGNPPPILIFASTKAVTNFGKDAIKEGAVITTPSTRELILVINKNLNL